MTAVVVERSKQNVLYKQHVRSDSACFKIGNRPPLILISYLLVVVCVRTFLFHSFPTMSSEQVSIPVTPKQEVKPAAAPSTAASSTASSVKSFLAGGFGGMASVMVG